MKIKTKIALVIGVATLAVTPVFAKGGTDMLHFAVRETLTDDGVEPGASGTVSISENVQGAANSQKLDVMASGLTPGADYDIVANVNGSGATDLGTFTADGKGKLAAHLSLGGKGKGKGSTPLPDGFDVSQIIGLDVVDATSTPVLSADTSAPTSLKYLVKRNLNNGGSANGTLQIKSSGSKTKYSLTATGLDPDTEYQIVFNGTPVETVTTNSKGQLKNTDAPLPDNILDLQTVEVWDGSNTAVLGTATPLP
jgi:hypothetical protein